MYVAPDVRVAETLAYALSLWFKSATESEAQFEGLPAADQLAVVAFLKTLVMSLIENNPSPQEALSPSM